MMGRRRRDRREVELAELDAFRHVRRAANEDVTVFGEELSALHFETLTTDLDDRMRVDYELALDAYESAKRRLETSAAATDVTEVTRTLADGRFAHACVLAARDGVERPARRPPCFFDPGHGPASRDVSWAPLGGVPRDIAVCFRDAERLAAGEPPQVRMVRLGNRYVPWYASGPAYTAWAGGWYAELVLDGRVQADRITMTYAGTTVGGSDSLLAGAEWADPGAWNDGGMIGGHDFSGWDGHGGDFGGGDFGGGDGGGGGGGDSG
jgi:uncharacterized membrane protein YgcG